MHKREFLDRDKLAPLTRQVTRQERVKKRWWDELASILETKVSQVEVETQDLALPPSLAICPSNAAFSLALLVVEFGRMVAT